MEIIAEEMRSKGIRPRILLHTCCAPCFSGCFERLIPWADFDIYFYNPNISSFEEYSKRAAELERFIKVKGISCKCFIEDYDPKPFLDNSKGLESCPERGQRCAKCFALRLEKTAAFASGNAYDYFTTTLTLSPLKNAEIINNIGENVATAYKAAFLPSDFKKKNGYLRSLELSKECGLYRQNYCGCSFSRPQ